MEDPHISSVRRIQGRLKILRLPNITPITASETLIEVLERIWTVNTVDLPRNVKIDLAGLGQEALQYAAHGLKRASGGQTPDLQTLRWEAPRLRRERNDDPLRLRMAIIARDMDEFCLANELKDYTATCILDAASEILLGCSGMAMTSEYSNGMIVHMPAVIITRVPRVRAAMSECVALVLCQLARYHSHWFGSNPSLSIILWDQVVPRKEVRPPQQSSLRSPESAVTDRNASDTGKRFATTQAQEEHWDLLKSKTEALLLSDIPLNQHTFIETLIPRALQVIDQACRCRHDSSLGTVSFDYDHQMQTFAQQALTFLAIRIDKLFPAVTVDQDTDDTVDDTANEPYQRSSTLRPRPLTTNPLVLRHWAILFHLDVLNRTDTRDLRNTAQNFFDTLMYASGLPTSAGVLRPDVPDVEDFVELVEIGVFDRMDYSLVENHNMDESWRADMRRYAKYALVGLAQCVSSIFGGEAMTLWGQTVPQRAEDRMKSHPWLLSDKELVV